MQLDCGDPNAKVNLPSRGLWYIPHNICSTLGRGCYELDAQAATRTEALTILRCKDWYTAFQFWQKFISEPRDHQLNLDDADLRGCSLANFFMPKISFRRANLAGVDFQHASLFGCDFTDGVLDNSTLHHANLSGAILRGATLLNADLRWAHLSGADCSNANISGSPN